MTEPATHGPLAAYMGMVLFLGAARADANPEQLEQLRTRLRPLIEDLRKSNQAVRPLLDAVLEVMGPQWRISPEWRKAIDGMLSA